MRKFLNWFLPQPAPDGEEGPASALMVVGRALGWAGSRAVLFIFMYVGLSIVGYILNWANPVWPRVIQTGIQIGMVLFVLFVPLGYSYMMATISKPNLQPFEPTGAGIRVVLSWAAGAAVAILGYLAIVRALFVVLGWARPDLVGLVVSILVVAGFLLPVLAHERRIGLTLPAAVLIYLALSWFGFWIIEWDFQENLDRVLWGLLAFLMFFLLAIGGRIISLSRAMQDRVFTAAGFCATFSGLAILAVFFVQIALQVSAWFYYTPQYVQKANEQIKAARIELANAEKVKAGEVARVDKEYAEGVQPLSQAFLEELTAKEDDKDPKVQKAAAQLREMVAVEKVLSPEEQKAWDARAAELFFPYANLPEKAEEHAQALERKDQNALDRLRAEYREQVKGGNPAALAARQAAWNNIIHNKTYAAGAEEFKAAMKAILPKYQEQLNKVAGKVKINVQGRIKVYTDELAKSDPFLTVGTLKRRIDQLNKVLKDMRDADHPYKGLLINLKVMYGDYFTYEGPRPGQGDYEETTLDNDRIREIFFLNEQLQGKGLFRNQTAFEDALRLAGNHPKFTEELTRARGDWKKVLAAAEPLEKDRQAVIAALIRLKELQEKHDGRGGVFRTRNRYEEALALAKIAGVAETLQAIGNPDIPDSPLFLFEGRDEYSLYEALISQDITIAEKKVVADMPLRETDSFSLFWYFLSHGPSAVAQPQDAGILTALLGSLWMGIITILFAVPVGVGAALYLEEYRTKGWLGRLIQVNINNLAGVPSVVYGILGAATFVVFFSKIETAHPDWGVAARNVLGGGLTLGLLTLPVVIVAAQEAIRAVPISIRQGAYALGATQWQTIWRNVLPMARPGILTGTILALSRAIGEAAPLVLFGALLFVDQSPSLFSRFTVMPMQIFGWADRPSIELEAGDYHPIWQYNAAMAIVVLMVLLLTLNLVAIILRNRAQRKMRY